MSSQFNMYLIHILSEVGSVFDDDGLMPGQRVENGVPIHIRYGLGEEGKTKQKNISNVNSACP